MITAQMLWEDSDPDLALLDRFGFGSPAAAAAWVARVLDEDYGLTLDHVDRIAISAHNLLVWTQTTLAGDPAKTNHLVKACRLADAHEWLTTRGALVRWLAAHDQPVAAPLRSSSGAHQRLRDGRSVGIQPVLSGTLLDGSDLVQARAAGAALANLHTLMADWPEQGRLVDARPVAGSAQLWALPEGDERVPPELRERLLARIANLPQLPRQPIHADFRGANLLWDGNLTGILDFEEARLDHAVVDLAHATCLLGTWFQDWRPLTPQAQDAFIAAYDATRPLSVAERAWLEPLVGWMMLGFGWLDEADRWLSREKSGPGRARTDDLRGVNAALYQLSYRSHAAEAAGQE